MINFTRELKKSHSQTLGLSLKIVLMKISKSLCERTASILLLVTNLQEHPWGTTGTTKFVRREVLDTLDTSILQVTLMRKYSDISDMSIFDKT